MNEPTYKEVSKRIIIGILKSSPPRPEIIRDLYEIHHNNDKVLLEHMEVVNNILEKGIKEMKGENNNDNSKNK